MQKIDLSKYNNDFYLPGNKIIRTVWYLINLVIFNCMIPYPNVLKTSLLRFFGARIGKKVIIKPHVNIKYPWFLEIGDNSWVGENVWLDNLCEIKIGNNVCISQGAYLFTGNHNYKKISFDLLTEPVIIEDGVWIGAKAVVCPGVILANHSIITVGSIVTKKNRTLQDLSGKSG